MDQELYLIDPQKDYFKVLGVSEDDDTEVIKKAYKRLALKHHPDRPGGDQRKMAAVNEAYDILGDDKTRTYYIEIRREYLSQKQRWSYTSEEKTSRRGRRKKRSGSSEKDDKKPDRTLKDFIIDSLRIFQRQVGIELSEDVLNDFKAAVKFVYNTWNHLKKTDRVDHYTFGSIRVRRVHRRRLYDGDNLYE